MTVLLGGSGGSRDVDGWIIVGRREGEGSLDVSVWIIVRRRDGGGHRKVGEVCVG